MPHGAGLQGPGLSLDEQLMYGRSDQSATFENDPLLPDGPRAFTRTCPCVRTRMHARHHAHVTLLRAWGFVD